MPALGHRAYLGAVKESTWGTAILSGFSFGEFMSETIQRSIQEIPVPQINTSRSFKKWVQGRVNVAGAFRFAPNPEDLVGMVLQNAIWGQQATVQVATLTVSASNNKLDFNIGGGPLVATIASGTYKPGNIQTDAGTLCKAIFDAIVAAEAVGTYTVTFSNSTKKFTITRTAGTLNLLWLTGANTATSIRTLIGYNQVDDTGSLSYASDSALTNVLFNHTFLTGDTNPGGLTLEIGRDVAVFDVAGATVNTLAFNAAVGELLFLEAGIMAREMATGSPAVPSYSTLNPFVFHQGVLTIDAVSANVTNFTLNHNGMLKGERYVIGSQFRLQPQSGRIDLTGSITKTFEGAGAGSVFAKFVAGSSAALLLTFTGDAVGASNYKLIVTLPKVFYTGPVDANASGAENELFQPAPFRAIYDDTVASEIKVELINARGTDY